MGASAASPPPPPPRGLPAPPQQPLAAPPLDPVRIGFVGVGGMGTAHVRNLVRIDGCAITAVCDIEEAHAERAAAIIEEAGHPRPTLYTAGESDFERLCAEEDLDLVYTATPWRWHVPSAWPPWRTASTLPRRFPPPTRWTTAGGWWRPPSAPGDTAS